MTHRLITAVCKADVNVKSALFRGNVNIIRQVQPKRLELSQLSSHPPNGFNKPFNQKNRNNSGACTAGGIGADRKYSSLSGGADGREGDEDKSKVGPGSGGKNKRQGLSSIAGIFGVCWVQLNKDLNWKGVVDNFLGRRIHLTQLVIAAKSSDPQIQFCAVCSLQKWLISSPNPPIDFLIGCNILPTLVDCLSNNKFIINHTPVLQLEALMALTIIIITAGRPEQSQAVVEAGAVPHFLRLLKSPDQDVRELALIALGFLIAKVPQLRDRVINLGVVASLLNCIQPDTTGKFLHEKAAAYALSAMTVGGKKEQVAHLIDCGVIPPFCNLLNCEDSQVVRSVLIGINNILAELSADRDRRDKACTLIKEFGGWDKIETLQNHENVVICKVARDILGMKTTFFSDDVEKKLNLMCKAAENAQME